MNWMNKEEVKNKLEMSQHNLMCYSANMLMNRPKPGFEKEFKIEADNVRLLTGWYEGLCER